jgi:Ca2+-binding EF-hand superfamily protein
LDTLLQIVKYIDSIKNRESDNSIKEAFNVYDGDQDGYIISKDLYNIISRVGGANKLTKEEASQMLNEFDMDVRGRIRTSDIRYC